MKYFLLILCLILCSCPFEEEVEPENLLSSSLEASSSSSVFSSSSSVEPELSILDCPPEDIAEYPIPDELPDDWMQTTPAGGCPRELKTSKEELLFGRQGEVRCITMDRAFGIYKSDKDCIGEEPYPWYYWYNAFKKMKCSWLTATQIDERVLHISVNKNETMDERKLNVSLSCQGSLLVTQSVE